MNNGKTFIASPTFVAGFMTVALGILLAKDGLANEAPKYKGPLEDQLKISQATKQKLGDIHILPNGNAYNSKTGEVLKVKADSGQTGSDVRGTTPFEGLEIGDSLKKRYNNLLPDQKNKVLFRIGEAQNYFKVKNQFKKYSKYKTLNSDINNEKLNNENITKSTERWIMYYFSINQKTQYIKKSGDVDKDFNTGESVESILNEIKAIYPETITQNDLLKAKEFDSFFTKERIRKADEVKRKIDDERRKADDDRKKADEKGLEKAKEFDRSFIKEKIKKEEEDRRKAEEKIKKAKEDRRKAEEDRIKKEEEKQRKAEEKIKKAKEEQRKAEEEGIKKAEEQRKNAKNIFDIGTKVR